MSDVCSLSPLLFVLQSLSSTPYCYCLVSHQVVAHHLQQMICWPKLLRGPLTRLAWRFLFELRSTNRRSKSTLLQVDHNRLPVFARCVCVVIERTRSNLLATTRIWQQPQLQLQLQPDPSNNNYNNKSTTIGNH